MSTLLTQCLTKSVKEFPVSKSITVSTLNLDPTGLELKWVNWRYEITWDILHMYTIYTHNLSYVSTSLIGLTTKRDVHDWHSTVWAYERNHGLLSVSLGEKTFSPLPHAPVTPSVLPRTDLSINKLSLPFSNSPKLLSDRFPCLYLSCTMQTSYSLDDTGTNPDPDPVTSALRPPTSQSKKEGKNLYLQEKGVPSTGKKSTTSVSARKLLPCLCLPVYGGETKGLSLSTISILCAILTISVWCI